MRWYSSSTVPGALGLAALLATGAVAGGLADEFNREFQQVGILPRQSRQRLQDNIQVRVFALLPPSTGVSRPRRDESGRGDRGGGKRTLADG